MKETSVILGIYCLIFLAVVAAMVTVPAFLILGAVLRG